LGVDKERERETEREMEGGEKKRGRERNVKGPWGGA
jgi:hypothetical protein